MQEGSGNIRLQEGDDPGIGILHGGRGKAMLLARVNDQLVAYPKCIELIL